MSHQNRSGDYFCVASGSFNQGDERFYPTEDRQCMANATAALGWMSVGGNFCTETIDEILITGDALYKEVRSDLSDGEIYLMASEVPKRFSILGEQIQIFDDSFAFGASFPVSRDQVELRVTELAHALENLMAEERTGIVFFFNGNLFTVAIWRRGSNYFLFNSHAVNERRVFDEEHWERNLARLFQCHSNLSLAALLLQNGPLDGVQRVYTIDRITFACPSISGMDRPQVVERDSDLQISGPHDVPSHELAPVVLLPPRDDQRSSLDQSVSRQSPMEPEVIPTISVVSTRGRSRPKKVKRGRPISVISMPTDEILVNEEQILLETFDPGLSYTVEADIHSVETLSITSDSTVAKRGRGRPIKVKRGRPKTLQTTREEQVRAAIKKYFQSNPQATKDASRRYTQQNPDVHRTAVREYSQQNSDVHRAAIRRYDEANPEVNREAVRRYSQQNPDVHREAVRNFRWTIYPGLQPV